MLKVLLQLAGTRLDLGLASLDEPNHTLQSTSLANGIAKQAVETPRNSSKQKLVERPGRNARKLAANKDLKRLASNGKPADHILSPGSIKQIPECCFCMSLFTTWRAITLRDMSLHKSAGDVKPEGCVCKEERGKSLTMSSILGTMQECKESKDKMILKHQAAHLRRAALRSQEQGCIPHKVGLKMANWLTSVLLGLLQYVVYEHRSVYPAQVMSCLEGTRRLGQTLNCYNCVLDCTFCHSLGIELWHTTLQARGIAKYGNRRQAETRDARS